MQGPASVVFAFAPGAVSPRRTPPNASLGSPVQASVESN